MSHLAADEPAWPSRCRNRPDDCSQRIHPADRHGKIPQVGHFQKEPTREIEIRIRAADDAGVTEVVAKYSSSTLRLPEDGVIRTFTR